jgi:acyl carrier protein
MTMSTIVSLRYSETSSTKTTSFLRPEMTADDVSDWDSLSHIRLVLAVSKAFNVKFTAAEVSRLKNVGELADLIRGKIG